MTLFWAIDKLSCAPDAVHTVHSCIISPNIARPFSKRTTVGDPTHYTQLKYNIIGIKFQIQSFSFAKKAEELVLDSVRLTYL